MSNTNQYQIPALRMEAWSINCIVLAVFANAANRNLLTIADSLTAHNVEYLFLMRLIMLIHLVRRNAQRIKRSIRKESPGVQNKFIVETTEYDAKGQVTKKSSPFLDGLETLVYTAYTYHPHDGSVTKVTNPDGSYSVPTYTGFNEKMESYAASGTLISSVELIKNAKGQVLERKVTSPPAPLLGGEGSNLSVKYQYDTAGRLTKILDPENGATTTVYDNAGRRISVTDPNSGTTAYTYDAVGNIKTQTDARNITTTFTYDKLNRPIEISYNPVDTEIPLATGGTVNGNTILVYDEGGKNKFANGRLTTVVDQAGKLELGYDIRGNRIYQKRQIDGLNVIFRRTFDIQNRLESTTYPDGKILPRLVHNTLL